MILLESNSKLWLSKSMIITKTTERLKENVVYIIKISKWNTNILNVAKVLMNFRIDLVTVKWFVYKIINNR